MSAFTVTGNSPGFFQMYLHGNGNINGAFDLASGSVTTLTGNSDVTFSYAGWDPALITMLEGKATSGETVNVTQGSSSFALGFTGVVPEPSSMMFIALAGVGAAVWRRRVLRARTTTR